MVLFVLVAYLLASSAYGEWTYTILNNITIELMFAGVSNYFFGPTQAHFSPSRREGLKWALSRAKNIFTPKNINSITIKITSEGI